MSGGPSEVLARAESELRALWSAPPASGETPKARASTMNLVVVASSPELAKSWVPVVDDVVQSVPARAILVGLDPDGPDALEANVSAVCTPDASSGAALCSERVDLTVRGGVCARLASCITGLGRTDVPTTLVWLGRVHADDPAFAPLALDASRIVLDATHGSLAGLANIMYWARARPAADRPGVADLAWTRLSTWQDLCARIFDEPRLRPLATHVTAISVTQGGPPGSALGPEGGLLLSWLATRLGWRAASLAGKLRLLRDDGSPIGVTLKADPAAHVGRHDLQAVRIEASAGGISLVGAIARDGDTASWKLDVKAPGGDAQHLEQRVRLLASDTARLLERTLRRPAHDDALAEAVAWADLLRGEELACG